MRTIVKLFIFALAMLASTAFGQQKLSAYDSISSPATTTMVPVLYKSGSNYLNKTMSLWRLAQYLGSAGGTNFATTDLTVTANRWHDFNKKGMTFGDAHYFNISDSTGDTVFTIGNFAARNNSMFRISPYDNFIQAHDKTHRAQWQLSDVLNYSGVSDNLFRQVSTSLACFTSISTDTVITFYADSATQRIWLGNYSRSKGLQMNWSTGLGSFSNDVAIGGVLSSYAGVATTAGNGVPVIVISARATGQTAANTNVASYTTPAADATYEVSSNVLVTTSGSENFSVTVAYTDEGSTSRTMTLSFNRIVGTVFSAINSANGAVPYAGGCYSIRCKGGTTITFATTGTFTGCTYNIDVTAKKIN